MTQIHPDTRPESAGEGGQHPHHDASAAQPHAPQPQAAEPHAYPDPIARPAGA